jgi:hypothetical protein
LEKNDKTNSQNGEKRGGKKWRKSKVSSLCTEGFFEGAKILSGLQAETSTLSGNSFLRFLHNRKYKEMDRKKTERETSEQEREANRQKERERETNRQRERERKTEKTMQGMNQI